MDLDFEQMLVEHAEQYQEPTDQEPVHQVVVQPCPQCGWPGKKGMNWGNWWTWGIIGVIWIGLFVAYAPTIIRMVWDF